MKVTVTGVFGGAMLAKLTVRTTALSGDVNVTTRSGNDSWLPAPVIVAVTACRFSTS